MSGLFSGTLKLTKRRLKYADCFRCSKTIHRMALFGMTFNVLAAGADEGAEHRHGSTRKSVRETSRGPS